MSDGESAYYRIPKWERYQHYRDRRPLWIKLHLSLSDDPGFLELSDKAKLHLVSLWLVAAKTDNEIPTAIRYLERHNLSSDPMEPDILIAAGLLELSPVLVVSEDILILGADPEQIRSLEKRREEKNKTPFAAAPHKNSKSPAKAEEPERNIVWDALVVALGDPLTRSEKSRRGKVVKELREAGASPQDVQSRVVQFRKTWPAMTLTDTALLKHWTLMTPPGKPLPPCPECGVGGGQHLSECAA